MVSLSPLLPAFFLIFSLFCSVIFGKTFQIRNHYRWNSFATTLLIGIPLYLIITMLSMIPTILIAFTADQLSYYLYTLLIILFVIALALAIYNRKFFKWKTSEFLVVSSVTSLVSLILIFANSNIPLSESTRILDNISDTSILGGNFIINDYSFCWVRYLSSWISIMQINTVSDVNLFIQYGVFIFFAFFATSVIFSIGKDILKWEKSVNLILGSIISIITGVIFAIAKLDIVSGFLFPLFVFLTILTLFFYTLHNVARTRSIRIIIAILFSLVFLLDYNTWGIGLVLMISLVLYQGYKARAIDLWDFIVWFLANMLNVIIVFSYSQIASIILVVLTGVLIIIVVRYLAGNAHARRFRLERSMSKYELLIILGAFIIMVASSIMITELTNTHPFTAWLEDGFWGKISFSSIWNNKLIPILLTFLVIGMGVYGFYFFWFSISTKKNLIMIIISSYVIFFFNPLVSPLYSLSNAKNLYYFGFIFLCSLLILGVLNFFKEIKNIKSSKFISLTPILMALMIVMLSFYIYSELSKAILLIRKQLHLSIKKQIHGFKRKSKLVKKSYLTNHLRVYGKEKANWAIS